MLVRLVLSQHFCSSNPPWQLGQDIDGSFFSLLLSPQFHTSIFVAKTIFLVGPCGPPHPDPLCRTMSLNPLMEANCLTTCH